MKCSFSSYAPNVSKCFIPMVESAHPIGVSIGCLPEPTSFACMCCFEESLRRDKSFLEPLMAKTPRVLGHASDKLRSDKDYMLLGDER